MDRRLNPSTKIGSRSWRNGRDSVERTDIRKAQWAHSYDSLNASDVSAGSLTWTGRAFSDAGFLFVPRRWRRRRLNTPRRHVRRRASRRLRSLRMRALKVLLARLRQLGAVRGEALDNVPISLRHTSAKHLCTWSARSLQGRFDRWCRRT
jgi:hypothetical protein